MSIEPLPEVPRDEWQQLGESCPWATLFQTPDWADVIVRHAPGLRPATRAFRLSDGSLAILPLTATPRLGGLMHPLQSQYGGKPGGILAPRPLEPGELQALYRQVLTPRASTLAVVRGPRDPHAYPGNTITRSTHVVALDPATPPREAYSASTRRGIRKAEESGVTVTEAGSAEEWPHLARLHGHSMERQQSSESLRPEFAAALAELPLANRRLWLARVEGQPVSCALVLYFRDQATYFLGGMDYDHQDRRPNNALFDAILHHAWESGVREFDMGGSLGLEGLERFKEGFGATRQEYQVFRTAHPIYRPFLKTGGPGEGRP